MIVAGSPEWQVTISQDRSWRRGNKSPSSGMMCALVVVVVDWW